CELDGECADAEGAATRCSEEQNGEKRCELDGSDGPEGLKASAGQACMFSCSFHGDGSYSCRSTNFDPAAEVPRYCLQQDGLRCAEDGRCGPLLAAGATCLGMLDSCELSLRCNGAICASRAALGEACSSSRDCPEDSKCVSSRCVATSAVGAACAPQTPCAGKASCEQGVCRVWDALDDVCSSPR
ncbi:MAG TPA: hypothetical protein VFZ61_02865, partial [Polyangiales bacterium]